jgi:hypothetical protein
MILFYEKINAYKEGNWKYSESQRELFVAASVVCDYTIKTFYI